MMIRAPNLIILVLMVLIGLAVADVQPAQWALWAIAALVGVYLLARLVSAAIYASKRQHQKEESHERQKP